MRQFLFLTLLLVAVSGGGGVQASPRSTIVPKKNLQESLRAALIEAKPKLGKLEDWQSILFDDEVVPQYSRFIRDYRPSANGVTADIDLESLKNYLAYSAPKGAKGEAAKIYVVMKGDGNCVKCVEAAPLLRKLLKTRVERRGFTVSFVNIEDAKAEAISAVNEKISELAQRTDAAGALLLDWRLLPVDSIDTAHADENHYGIRVFETARIGVSGATREYKSESRLELLDNDSFVASAERLLTDAFTDLGSKVQVAKGESPDASGAEELWVEVSGIRSFAHFIGVKTQLQTALRTWGIVEERKVARGQVSFAIHTSHKIDELKQLLASMRVTGFDERVLKVAAE